MVHCFVALACFIFSLANNSKILSVMFSFLRVNIKKLARYTGAHLSRMWSELSSLEVRQVNGQYFLKEKLNSHNMCYLRSQKCTVQEEIFTWNCCQVVKKGRRMCGTFHPTTRARSWRQTLLLAERITIPLMSGTVCMWFSNFFLFGVGKCTYLQAFDVC